MIFPVRQVHDVLTLVGSSYKNWMIAVVEYLEDTSASVVGLEGDWAVDGASTTGDEAVGQ